METSRRAFLAQATQLAALAAAFATGAFPVSASAEDEKLYGAFTPFRDDFR